MLAKPIPGIPLPPNALCYTVADMAKGVDHFIQFPSGAKAVNDPSNKAGQRQNLLVGIPFASRYSDGRLRGCAVPVYVVEKLLSKVRAKIRN